MGYYSAANQIIIYWPIRSIISLFSSLKLQHGIVSIHLIDLKADNESSPSHLVNYIQGFLVEVRARITVSDSSVVSQN